MELNYLLTPPDDYRCYAAEITGHDDVFVYRRSFVPVSERPTARGTELTITLPDDGIYELTYEYMDDRERQIRVRRYLLLYGGRLCTLRWDELSDWLDALLFDLDELEIMVQGREE